VVPTILLTNLNVEDPIKVPWVTKWVHVSGDVAQLEISIVDMGLLIPIKFSCILQLLCLNIAIILITAAFIDMWNLFFFRAHTGPFRKVLDDSEYYKGCVDKVESSTHWHVKFLF
jgi:hypothetical protein